MHSKTKATHNHPRDVRVLARISLVEFLQLARTAHLVRRCCRRELTLVQLMRFEEPLSDGRAHGPIMLERGYWVEDRLCRVTEVVVDRGVRTRHGVSRWYAWFESK